MKLKGGPTPTQSFCSKLYLVIYTSLSIINYSKFVLNYTKSYIRPAEAVVQRCSVKTVFLEISQNSQENTCARFSFLIKLQAYAFYRTPPVAASKPTTLLKKEDLAQVFSCEFCEISKNIFFAEHFLATTSEILWDNKNDIKSGRVG